MSQATKIVVVAAFVAALGVSNAASARARLHPLTRCVNGSDALIEWVNSNNLLHGFC